MVFLAEQTQHHSLADASAGVLDIYAPGDELVSRRHYLPNALLGQDFPPPVRSPFRPQSPAASQGTPSLSWSSLKPGRYLLDAPLCALSLGIAHSSLK